MAAHPLISLANDKQVKQASAFRKVAASLTGAKLAELYAGERDTAPSRHAKNERYLVGHSGKLRAAPKTDREEHLAIALCNWCRESGGGLPLPEGEGTLDLAHCRRRC